MDNSIEQYFLFFPLTLIMVVVPIFLAIIFSTLIGKIFFKENLKINLKNLKPFFGILLMCYFVFSIIWDLFIESKGRLFTYWDQMPFAGFYLFSHDQPATRSLSQDLTPSVTLLTLDAIWLGMLILMYSFSVMITYFIFWRKNPKTLKYAIFISLALLLVGFTMGWGYRGKVI